MAIENKEELIKKLAVLEAENLKLRQHSEELNIAKKEILSLKKSNEEIIANEHNIKKLLTKSENVVFELKEKEKEFLLFKKNHEETIANENNIRKLFEKAQQEVTRLQTYLDSKEKQIEVLKNDLNKLAGLFDEYILAYQDQVKMLGVFVKNTQTVEKYLSGKIEEYNGGSKK